MDPTVAEATVTPDDEVVTPGSPDTGEGFATPAACTDADADAVTAVVDDQLAAFADGDFEAALSLATTDFQSTFTVERFQDLIETDFPVVRGNVSREVGACLVQPQGDEAVATLDVTVTDDQDSVQALRYLLEQEAGTWRIGGAVPLEATV